MNTLGPMLSIAEELIGYSDLYPIRQRMKLRDPQEFCQLCGKNAVVLYNPYLSYLICMECFKGTRYEHR